MVNSFAPMLILGIFIVFSSFICVFKGKLHARYGILWIAAGLVVCGFGWRTPLADMAGSSLYVLLILLIGKAFFTDVVLTRKELQVRRLSQQFALLESRLRVLEGIHAKADVAELPESNNFSSSPVSGVTR